MTKIVSAFGVIATALLVLASSGAARAQASITWLSGTGSGTACTRAAPCASLGAAYAATAAGGEIDILDGGAFGNAVIQKSLTIVNVGAGVASVTEFQIDISPTDEVILRGLNFVLNPSAFFAIEDETAGSLVIDHCTFHEYQDFYAIGVITNAAAKLRVVDTVVSNSGSSSEAALYLLPQSGGSVTAQLERVQIMNSGGNAIRADSTASGAGPITVQLHDVTVDGSSGGSGIVAVSPTSGGAKATIIADNVTSVNNAGYGFRAVGGTASIVLRRSMNASNAVGIGASSGGQIFSYGDNSFAGNISGDGVTPTPIGLK
jgi:hypothetical protein